MGNIRHPRRGSLQFWPRKRSKHALARPRSWVQESKTKPLAFIGYKAGMTHLMVVDNRPKSLTKGETIAVPATIIECPPVKVVGISFYSQTYDGLRKTGAIMSAHLDKELSRTIPLPKTAKNVKTDFPAQFDDLRLLVQTASPEAKKPHLLEIAIGGTKDDKVKYAHTMLDKEIALGDVFQPGHSLDVHGVTTGKGFQGTVKRYGVPIRQHKAEKTKRGIATLGSWTPKRVEWTVAQSGKMGYHLRTEYNKQILKIGTQVNDVNPKGGIIRYGLVQYPYLLIKGSVVGPPKRAVVMTPSLRPNLQMTKEAPEIKYISH